MANEMGVLQAGQDQPPQVGTRMQRHSAIHNVTQAMRVLKDLSLKSEEFNSLQEVSRQASRVALGITLKGKREILDFQVARSEEQSAWEAFLQDLQQRGLTGEGMAVIVTDGGAGLLAALPLIFSRAHVQRCWAHKTRNVLDKVLARIIHEG